MPEKMTSTIAEMPRGGPRASWLDRQLQTNVLEYTDRYDIDDGIKQQVISGLDRAGRRMGTHDEAARLALQAVSDVDSPRILELGAGHGRLSLKILELHPTATVTISDLDPTSVANIAASELGANPRVRTEVIDAASIAASDNSYDLVVFASAFHHLPPAVGHRAIAEATRVGSRFLVIDLKRKSPWSLLLMVMPLMGATAIAAVGFPRLRPLVHDGLISSLRAYSRSAFIALGKAADPRMRIDFLAPSSWFVALNSTVVAFARPAEASVASRTDVESVDGTCLGSPCTSAEE